MFVRNEPYCSFLTQAEIRGEPFHVVGTDPHNRASDIYVDYRDRPS